MSVLIKGGHIVTAADDYVADILVEGETVAEIGRSLDVSADRVIDAPGKYVIPGAIDPHTHMEMPFGGTVTCDDFTSGTTSAAFGGITSLIDFCLQAPGQSIPDALATWHEKIERCPPVIDVGFHLAITDLHDGGSSRTWPGPRPGRHQLQALHGLQGRDHGRRRDAVSVMQVAAETGALVMVHAENGDVIDVLVKQALAEGKTEPSGMPRLGRPTPRARRPAARSSSPTSPTVRCTWSTSPARSRSSRLQRRARPAGGSGARPAPSTCSSSRRTSRSPTSRAPSTCSRRRRAPAQPRELCGARSPTGPCRRSRATTARSGSPTRRPRQGRLLKDPQWRTRDREPAAHAPSLRRARGPDVDEPPRGPVLHAARQAVRAVPAQGHDRSRQRRRHRRVGQR